MTPQTIVILDGRHSSGVMLILKQYIEQNIELYIVFA